MRESRWVDGGEAGQTHDTANAADRAMAEQIRPLIA